MKRALTLVVIFFALWSLQSAGQSSDVFSSQDPNLDCGKYSKREIPNQGWVCQRLIIFPWFAAGDGWKTQINIVADENRETGILYSLSLSSQNGQATLAVVGISGIYSIISGIGYGRFPGQSVTFEVVEGGTCKVVDGQIVCDTVPGLLTGNSYIRFSAPNVETLEALSTQLVFFHYGEYGIADWQVAVPPIWYDEASPKWSGYFSETPNELKLDGNVKSHNTSFAVANLHTEPQSVLVSVYDQNGKFIASASTPVLEAGNLDPFGEGFVIPGGVRAFVLSDFLGNAIKPGVFTGYTVSRDQPFQGTIRFEGSAGGRIAPLVLRAVGGSITYLVSKPVKMP